MKYHRQLIALALGAAAAVLGTSTALADCTGFKWPLDTELKLFASGGDVLLKSGGELATVPAKVIALTLQPAKSVTLPFAPGVKEQAVGDDTFSGWFTITGIVKPGLYQVTLSANGWIDVAQNGALVPSHGFTGKRDCDIVRKSVRFEIGSGPITVQVSGAPTADLRLTVSEAK